MDSTYSIIRDVSLPGPASTHPRVKAIQAECHRSHVDGDRPPEYTRGVSPARS